MDKAVLVMFPLEAGKQLAEALDKDGFNVQAALWLYRPESDSWRLMIASALVDKIGPTESYKRILAKLQSIREKLDPLLNELYLNNITIVSPWNSLIRALKKVVHVGKEDAPVRLNHNAIDDVF